MAVVFADTSAENPSYGEVPSLRLSQEAALALPYVGMAVIVDLGKRALQSPPYFHTQVTQIMIPGATFIPETNKPLVIGSL
jgi:hypothetical protein